MVEHDATRVQFLDSMRFSSEDVGLVEAGLRIEVREEAQLSDKCINKASITRVECGAMLATLNEYVSRELLFSSRLRGSIHFRSRFQIAERIAQKPIAARSDSANLEGI
jgi:hypothetical protein